MITKDYDNVTYRHIFIISFLIIVPSVFWVSTDILTKSDKTNGFLSLFLMGTYALVYVIALYLVADKMFYRIYKEGNETKTGMFNSWGNSKKTWIASIYGLRYLIRTVFLLYFFINGIKILMLQQHHLWSILIPLVLFLVYLGNKGIEGYISFGEAVFWSIIVCIVIFVVCLVGKADLSQLNELMRIESDGGICYTICTAMIRGYMLLVGLSALEFIIYLYMKIKDRKRTMLISSIGVPAVLSLIGSILVIITLGRNYINQGDNRIQDIVGAFAWPGGHAARLGILVCYVFIVAAIMITGIHVAYTLQIIKFITVLYGTRKKKVTSMDKKKTANEEKKLYTDDERKVTDTEQAMLKKDVINKDNTHIEWIKVIYAGILIILYIIAYCIFKIYDAGKCGLIYMLAVDIPLSVVVPAFACRRKGNTGIYARSIIGMVLMLLICTGCSYKSVEDVDYLRIVMVEDVETYEDRDIFSFTLLVDSLSNASSAGESENIVCTYKGTSLEQVIARYDMEHEKTLDMSHVEYLVVDNDNTLDNLYKELEGKFGFDYVEIIRKEDIPSYISEEDLREYIANHNKGECLATYNGED